MTSKVFWKHEIDLRFVHTSEHKFALPKGAEIVHVAEQGPRLVFWFRCDPRADVEARTFVFVGTGHEHDESLVYRGTSLHQRGNLVLHLLERVGE